TGSTIRRRRMHSWYELLMLLTVYHVSNGHMNLHDVGSFLLIRFSGQPVAVIQISLYAVVQISLISRRIKRGILITNDPSMSDVVDSDLRGATTNRAPTTAPNTACATGHVVLKQVLEQRSVLWSAQPPDRLPRTTNRLLSGPDSHRDQ